MYNVIMSSTYNILILTQVNTYYKRWKIIFLSRNSLSLDMMEHLIEAINHNKNDISLRAIVLAANGNVFSAGHNLKELVSTN